MPQNAMGQNPWEQDVNPLAFPLKANAGGGGQPPPRGSWWQRGRLARGQTKLAILAICGWMMIPVGVQAQSSPEVIKICVNRLLYERTFSDGTPSGNRTIIDPRSAAIACQGVRSLSEAANARLCVNRLLYTSTFSDGMPSGQRTIVDPESAAWACSPCQNCVR